MPKVLAIIGQSDEYMSACDLYRVTLPFHHLNGRYGWKAEWTWLTHLQQSALLTSGGSLIEMIYNHDIFVFPRYFVRNEMGQKLSEALFSIIRRFPDKRIVYETDDDLSNRYRQVLEGDSTWFASRADAITVTTPYLKTTMERLTGRPVYVLPNSLPESLWVEEELQPRRALPGDALIIGLTGSHTHERDWRVLEGVLGPILEQHEGRVHLLMLGYHPEYLQGLPHTTYLEGVPYEIYSQFIRQCDIILAPIDPTDGFNNGKSPLKAIEGMMAQRRASGLNAGACVIATDHPVYRLAIEHGRHGYLVEHISSDWSFAIRHLIADKDKRWAFQLQGHEHALKNFSSQKNAKYWAKAYDQILRTEKSPGIA